MDKQKTTEKWSIEQGDYKRVKTGEPDYGKLVRKRKRDRNIFLTILFILFIVLEILILHLVH